MDRCFDCLADLPPGAPRAAVLVKMRELSPNWQGDDIARAFAEAACYDMKHVCADCAGWYGNDAVPIGEANDVLEERQQEIRIDTYCALQPKEDRRVS
jgi:hypothetical protein